MQQPDLENESLKTLADMLSEKGRARVIRIMRKRIIRELIAEGVITTGKPAPDSPEAPMQGKAWTKEADILLRGYYKTEQIGAEEIAMRMGRSATGIKARLVRLGLEEHRKNVRM